MWRRSSELISYAWKDTKYYSEENLQLCGVPLIIVIDLVYKSLLIYLENLASILELDEHLNEYFNIYSDAPENERNKDAENNIFGGAASKDDNFFIW